MAYLMLKWIHILSATILFGTGIGSAFYMYMANRRGDIAEIYFMTRQVVIADWLFTMPAVFIQFFSGLALVHLAGYSFSYLWILWALFLFFLAGVFWLPVVWIQIQMRDMAKAAFEGGKPLPVRYWVMTRWWTILGCLAFPTVILIVYFMVFKPLG